MDPPPLAPVLTGGVDTETGPTPTGVVAVGGGWVAIRWVATDKGTVFPLMQRVPPRRPLPLISNKFERKGERPTR